MMRTNVPHRQMLPSSPLLICSRVALGCFSRTATVAILEKHPNATREQISRGLDGNICRCGTFVRIMEAANMAKAKGVARG